MRHFGLDFGTTNSAVAVVDDGQAERPQLARFAPAIEGQPSASTFRSLLYFDPELVDARGKVKPLAGPHGIRQSQHSSGGRLVQSLKSYLASKQFTQTAIFGVSYKLEALITLILKSLRHDAEQSLGPLGDTVVVGRPVRFVSAESPDDEALALSRLKASLAAAGFEHVTFEFEPVAAAYHYASQLDHDELVLVADFGGGTSDFCLCKVGPSMRTAGKAGEVLGTSGVPLAGDSFDGDLVWNVVAPELGLGSKYRAPFGTQQLEVPRWIFGKLRRWHYISFLKTRDTMEFLSTMTKQSQEPQKIEALMRLIDFELGFALYRAVEQTKVALSGKPAVDLIFDDADVPIHQAVSRAQFNGFIAESLDAIATSVDGLLEQANVPASQVDRVFLTGGSSLVPAVRAIFEQRFGAPKLRSGDELTSVASGLALRARDLKPRPH